jgi:putative SOS response-associated peptidase YedK
MCGRFVLYAQPAKVAWFLQAVTPQGVKCLNPGLEKLYELQKLLKPANKGMLEHYPVSRDVGKVTNNGKYLLELNSR